MRKICVVTNTRADYSRLRTLLFSLRDREDVELTLCVAGSHLLALYGRTIKDIENDGFKISYRIYTSVDGHVLSTMTKSTGLAIIEFSSFFENNRPDVVVVHGDRFEAFAAATAASMMNIHVAHIQGGEITGTIDEHLRHAVTKLSHLHFASDEISKKRICALGERPEHVFNFGCPSADILVSTPEYSFTKLKEELSPIVKKKSWLESLSQDFFLLIHHPVTTEYEVNGTEMHEVLNALKHFSNPIFILWPNIDAGAEQIVEEIKKFERENDERIGVVNNMSIELFINVMKNANVMLGNSSAGVREACYFGTPVINIGSRQKGRLATANVINTGNNANEIRSAIAQHLNRRNKFEPEQPYGNGDAGKRIADVLATIELGSVQKQLILHI